MVCFPPQKSHDTFCSPPCEFPTYMDENAHIKIGHVRRTVLESSRGLFFKENLQKYRGSVVLAEQ